MFFDHFTFDKSQSEVLLSLRNFTCRHLQEWATVWKEAAEFTPVSFASWSADAAVAFAVKCFSK